MTTNQPTDRKAWCCYCDEAGKQCGADAAYEVMDEKHPYDGTHACLAHVGELMTDAAIHVVTKLDEHGHAVAR